jgi:hypothetical protein
VQFDYQSRTISGNFSGRTVENRPAQPVNCLRHIFFPAAGTGYLLTYSDFGMVYSYSLRRQMSSTGSPPVIQDGIESANVSFNYPATSSPALTAPPSFTQRTETATNSPSSTYTCSTTTDTVAQTKTFTITRPDASTVSLARSTNSASPANGLLVGSEIKSSSGASFGRSTLAYVNDGGGSPQVASVTAYDDATPTNQARADFDYDQYGNITNKREYGFQAGGVWQVQRRVQSSYKTDPPYLSAFLRSLVTETDLYDGNNNLQAKTTYAYDDYAAMGGMEDYGGIANPPGHYSSCGTAATLRGNVTGITEWTDLAANATIQHLAKYDVFGKVVKAQVSCCQEQDLTNTQATYWSETSIRTMGDPSPAGVHQITSTDYDFNTGLPRA